MSRVMIIGTGNVGTVTALKCAKQRNVFSGIVLANRTLQKALALRDRIGDPKIAAVSVNADDSRDVARLIENFAIDLVINTALPAQDVPIMAACAQTGASYIDTANSERRDKIEFNYLAQLAFDKQFRDKGATAILGCGSDPGFASVFVAYAKKHLFDRIDKVDIMDADNSRNGKLMAFNLNAAVKIRELLHPARYYEAGSWKTAESFSIQRVFSYPEIGEQPVYLIDHEELEPLAAHFSEIRTLRFWMSFSSAFIENLRLLQAIGLTSIEPVRFDGMEIRPLEFLEAMFRQSGLIVPETVGQTWIGCQISGTKNGCQRECLIYNVCDHEKCQREVGLNAVPFAAGVPPMIGAKLMLSRVWHRPGVFTVDQFDPDPFLEEMARAGLPWEVKITDSEIC